MFAYTDPTGAGTLEREEALVVYRSRVDGYYREGARQLNSAFTLLSAFDELGDGARPETAPVEWLAFPRLAGASNEEIDRIRFRLQEEYVEWRTERNEAGQVTRVTFTTEFSDYYEALAEVGLEALVRGIQEVIPGAEPTASELFGPNFNPAAATGEGRARQFAVWRKRNPWNNGDKGILCLAHPSNTLPALIGLLVACGIVDETIPSNAVCGNVGGACVPGRNSDPLVCTAAQDLARGRRAFTLADPAGIEIGRLGGIWKLDGRQIDINDPADNGGAWSVTRNGRRGTLVLREGLTLRDAPVRSGAEIAALLQVAATVVFAPEDALPAWARTGQESTRAI